jgi:hypothetical protein
MSWSKANALALIREVGIVPVMRLLPHTAGQGFAREANDRGSGAGVFVYRPVLGKSIEVRQTCE